MAKREQPGQVRVHRGFLQADGRRELWPEGEEPRVRRLKDEDWS